MCAVLADIHRQCTPNVHIACSSKTPWVSKHHFLHFLSKVWRCASTGHSCLVTQRSDTGLFWTRVLRQVQLALRLLYEWRNSWSMGCGAARGYSGSSSRDVTCLYVCTVYIHNRSVRLHSTHDTTPFARNARKYVVFIHQSLLEKAERATSWWLRFDVCH